MKVLFVEPNKEPVEHEVANTLAAMQALVHGPIEGIYLEPGCILVCNEEGWLEEMPYNRRVQGMQIYGPFFLCGVDGAEYGDLPDAHMQEYKQQLAMHRRRRRRYA